MAKSVKRHKATTEGNDVDKASHMNDDTDHGPTLSDDESVDDHEESIVDTTTTTSSILVPTAGVGPIKSDGRYHNKQRCLTLCSRGVTARYRHLLEDLRILIPHNKKESKLDCGSNDSIGTSIASISEIRNCNTVLYMECRKRQDAYLYMGYPHKGPSVKFHLTNVHTMDELRLTGNCMKYSRPVLSFDSNFTQVPHLVLLKEIFIDIFGTPRGHPKSKPFVDRVMAFYYGDQRVRVCGFPFRSCICVPVCVT
jgi:ribosome biogenesis protein BRX1